MEQYDVGGARHGFAPVSRFTLGAALVNGRKAFSYGPVEFFALRNHSLRTHGYATAVVAKPEAQNRLRFPGIVVGSGFVMLCYSQSCT